MSFIMESEDAKAPFELSLDEIIALNQSRNKEPDLEPEDNVDERLRSIPNFGSKPIHSRLGYQNNNNVGSKILQDQVKFKHTQQKNCHANNLLRKARKFLEQRNKIPHNPVVQIRNPNAFKLPFLAPLTRRSISTFNRQTKGFISRPHGSNKSSFSLQSTQMRHSIQRVLNVATQSEIRNLAEKHTPTFDMDFVEEFVPPRITLSLTTNERFGLYC